MRRIIFILILVFLVPSYSNAGWWASALRGIKNSQFIESFDASGYDNAGWTEISTPNEDRTLTPCPLSGLQSLGTSYGKQSITPLLSITGAVTWETLFHTTVGGVCDQNFVTLLNSAGATIGYLQLRSSGKVRIFNGAISSESVGTLSAGTTYRVWIDYAPSTGSNGVLRVYITAYTGSETKPESAFVSITTGTSTYSAQKIRIGMENCDTGGNNFFDDVKVYNQ